MRQPSEIGVSQKASTPPLEPWISECTLWLPDPTPSARPCQLGSKLAAPEPRSPGWWGSP